MSTSTRVVEDTVKGIVEAHQGKLGALLPVLHDVQENFGHIPAEVVPVIARALSLSRAEIHGVIGFYHDFRTEPVGKHTIHICRAEACQAMGSSRLEQHARERLGVDYGETTADGQFTLEPVYCLGNCACSPSIRVNDRFHARVSPDHFDEILSTLEQSD